MAKFKVVRSDSCRLLAATAVKLDLIHVTLTGGNFLVCVSCRQDRFPILTSAGTRLGLPFVDVA